MGSRARRAVIGAVTVGLVASGAVLSGAAADYSDPEYLAYDLDNMARTSEDQSYHVTSDSYREASREIFLDTWLQGLARQYRDLDDGRVYAGLGQIAPGGNVGDPEHHLDGPRLEVEFLNREGTKLVGNVWPCRSFLERASAGQAAGGCPLVVVTTGSIQVTQHMYGYLARHLQDSGYTVFTFDVRGQGESETTNPSNPFQVNPQDGASFQNGTVDALRFALSSGEAPYVPVGMTPAQVDAYAASTHVDRFNPVSAAVDGARIGLVGHSLGASAVTAVQQCTSVNPSTLPLSAACNGERFPIRAIVAYDSLGSSPDPRVPAFNHVGDGYFINAVPTPTPPDPGAISSAGSSYGKWRAAGQDACVISGRGFTHADWSEIPYIVSGTRTGTGQAKYYTRAWFDRFVSGDPDVQVAGHDALSAGPIPAEAAGSHADHRASLFSGKSRSACSVSAIADRAAFASSDLRAYAGVAAVGDWAALNDEREYGTSGKGALHLPTVLAGP